MTDLKCGCEPSGPRIWCPYCGSYLYDMFLSEPFPDGFDSPSRKILQKIHAKEKSLFYTRSSGKLNILRGTELWGAIKSAIEKSEICVFDISDEIVNVGFELGFSLAQETSKYILLGSHYKPESHIIKFFKINPFLPQEKKYSDAIESFYQEDYNELVKNQPDIAIDIKKNQELLSEELFVNNIPEKLDQMYGAVEFPSKKKKKDVLLITTKNHKNYFETHKKELTKFNIMSFDDFNPFENVNQTCYFLSRVCKKIIKEYDYLIVHLVGKKTDGYQNANDHNFMCSIISGMMRGYKRDLYLPDYYLAHENNNKPELRCSDLGDIARYSRLEDVNGTVDKIISQYILLDGNNC